MADIKKTLKLVWTLEYGDNPEHALEKNVTESDMTYKGIYRTAHPNWAGWGIIDAVLAKTTSMCAAGKELEDHDELQDLVTVFYKQEFWDKMRLDEIEPQKIADEMMIFGINAGTSKAIKLAQKTVLIEPDGIIGPKTIAALNGCDVKYFDIEFDVEENKYYDALVEKNPKFKIYARGWRNRAEYV